MIMSFDLRLITTVLICSDPRPWQNSIQALPGRLEEEDPRSHAHHFIVVCWFVLQHPSLAIVKAAGLIMKAIIEVNLGVLE